MGSVLKPGVRHFSRHHFVFLEPVVTIFGGEGGAVEERGHYQQTVCHSKWSALNDVAIAGTEP